MSTKMSRAEREAFVKEVRVGVLAFNRPGRGPLAVPLWYDYAPGGDIWFMTQRQSIKGKLIEVGGRMSLCVQDEHAPYRYVSVEGPVTEIRPYTIDDDILPMAQRYLGQDGGRRYADNLRQGGTESGGIRVVLHPETWLTVDYGKAG